MSRSQSRLVGLEMAAAEEATSSTTTQHTQQQEEVDPIMVLAQDMFHKTADYLNGEFDSTYSPRGVPEFSTQLLFYTSILPGTQNN